MISCLNQSNVYIKRQLRVWKSQKCNFLVGAKTLQTSRDLQNHSFHAAPYRAYNGILRKFQSTYRPGTFLHQSNAYIKRKLPVWRAQKFNFLVGAKTVPTSTGLQTTPFHPAPYRADNRILRKFGSTYRQGTVFVPTQCLYQKEATDMESLKMSFSSRCKNLSDQYGPTNHTVSCCAM